MSPSNPGEQKFQGVPEMLEVSAIDTSKPEVKELVDLSDEEMYNLGFSKEGGEWVMSDLIDEKVQYETVKGLGGLTSKMVG